MRRVTEQEVFKDFLQSLIHETENDNITSTDEIIKLIVHELQKLLSVNRNRTVMD